METVMILSKDPETGYWTKFEGETDIDLVNVHDPGLCTGRGCAIHDHPSDHPLKDAPLNWRTARGILERICEHNVGHPDRDSAQYLESIGKGYENVHGCCGTCC